MKFINRINKFMCNRYGVDDLYSFMFKLYLIIFLLNLFIKSSIITSIELLLIVIILYRFLSKNKYKRIIENKRYLYIRNKIYDYFSKFKRKYKDGYIYKKCPKCNKLLKLPLPYKRGIKKVKCPKCKKTFKMLVLRKEKIEIISNKR